MKPKSLPLGQTHDVPEPQAPDRTGSEAPVHCDRGFLICLRVLGDNGGGREKRRNG